MFNENSPMTDPVRIFRHFLKTKGLRNTPQRQRIMEVFFNEDGHLTTDVYKRQLHNARLIRWGKPSQKDERAEAKEAIHSYLQELIEQGRIRQRQDVILALLEACLLYTSRCV